MTAPPGGCPVRKLAPPQERGGPALERVSDPDGDRWVVRSFALARQVLRAEDTVAQAGFGADRVARATTMRPPILYLEGGDHREQRRAAARLFAPAVVESYRPMITEVSERLVAGLRSHRSTDLSRLAVRLSTEVVAKVVGLTNSSLAGMTRRLSTFFDSPPPSGPWRPRRALSAARTTTATLRFYHLDVKPAIRARRRRRREDVISQVLDRGFSDLEVLTECLTYGAAGMVTTREFVTVGAWHLLSDPRLLSRFRASDRRERTALLEETLRLEPVVGRLYRRVVRPVELRDGKATARLEPGDLVDLDLRAVNADAAAVGEHGLQLCPGRELGRAVPATGMSFGDGNHRCPGGPLALLESEIFLSWLFHRDLEADHPPEVRWNPVSQGYDLRRFPVRLAREPRASGEHTNRA